MPKNLKKFEFEFIDESESREISFDYDDVGEADEDIEMSFVGDTPIVHANSKALITLAKLFIKLALGNYKSGFHVHIRKNFDGDESDIMIVTLK